MSKKYTPTIGLEIHAELSTKTKMFCNSKNDPDETEPNVNVCPVCMGHPGTLPTINKRAVKYILMVGHALDGTIADFTEFDRKHYFYPDIPKGYQISQYDYPLVAGGELCEVPITRVHLEEDTANSKHANEENISRVDFNRAGIPLMELVTEPAIHSGKEASNFARELQLLLQHLDVSDAHMEKGEMRIEANVSVSDSDKKGTKVEIKNLNSFTVVERALQHEIDRQIEVLERGDAVKQQTRGWDEDKQETFAQRTKETSEDYRYFPDPDLPKLRISEVESFSSEHMKDEMPELPDEKRQRYSQAGIADEDIETFLRQPALGAFFDDVVEHLNDQSVDTAVNYITSDLIGMVENTNTIPVDPQSFATLIQMVEAGDVSSSGATQVMEILVADGGDPQTIAEEEGLLQESSEEALAPLVEEIIDENPDVADDYASGKDEAVQFLIGQGMQKSGGSADPNVLKEILKDTLR